MFSVFATGKRFFLFVYQKNKIKGYQQTLAAGASRGARTECKQRSGAPLRGGAKPFRASAGRVSARLNPRIVTRGYKCDRRLLITGAQMPEIRQKLR